ESGLISYSYVTSSGALCSADPAAVCFKKGLSPNQPSNGTALLTATYSYDVLSRLIGKSYNDTYTSNPPTPSVAYGYDGTALVGCATTAAGETDPFPTGRRTSMCDASGATSWAHDEMGRVTQERRQIGGGSLATKFVDYTYNLDGSLAVLQTPPLKTIRYTY